MDENNNFEIEKETEGLASPDDDFIIGKGFTVAEENLTPIETKGEKKRSPKKLIYNIVWIVAIVIVSCSIAFGAIYIGADYLGVAFGRNGESVTFEIERGSSTKKIAETLKSEGIINSPLAFRLYSKLKHYDSRFKYGVYTVDDDCGYEVIAQKLMTEGAEAKSVKVTIPEGTGINDYTKNVNGENVTIPGIATILEKNGVCSKGDFFIALNEVVMDSDLLKNANVGKTYYALEGYLFPDTYEFYYYDSKECAKLAIERMISESEKRITKAMMERADKLGYTMNEVLTMASIIQMESGQNTAEMANVAAVFYNRLKSDNFTSLGSSPTIYYGKSFGSRDDGRYHTQAEGTKFSAIEGLPPGPICSPGIEAINAALNPTEDFPYYFFVTDKTGKFYYRKTLSEHNKIISQLQSSNNWVYEKFD